MARTYLPNDWAVFSLRLTPIKHDTRRRPRSVIPVTPTTPRPLMWCDVLVFYHTTHILVKKII